MITIVDFEMGNLGSVARAFQRVKQDVVVTSDASQVAKAERLVFPGVGSFARGMENMARLGLSSVLEERVLGDKVPVLGICLGFQMFTEHSEEGDAAGLGWVKGRTKRFVFEDAASRLKVPHMGWNDVRPARPHPLFESMSESPDFFFQHSFAVECDESEAVLGTSEYGYAFVSIIEKGNIIGTQFHPEKSHANGLQLVRNWVDLTERK